MNRNTYDDFIKKFDQSKLPKHKSIIFEKPKLIKFGRLINVLGDRQWQEKHKERSGLFCRLQVIGKKYYVFLSIQGSIYWVREFNEDWKFTGFEKRLTPEGEFDIDQDIAYDGEYILNTV